MRWVGLIAGWSVLFLILQGCSGTLELDFEQGDACTRDTQCPDGFCVDGECKNWECRDSADCPPGGVCFDHECVIGDGDAEADWPVVPDGDKDPDIVDEEVCLGVPCLTDADCCTGYVCDPTSKVCKPVECVADADCLVFGSHYKCNLVNHQCYYEECESSADCDAGEICEAGICVEIGGCASFELYIRQGSGVVATGRTVQLSVDLFNLRGEWINSEGFFFDWVSDNPAVVSVDQNGLLTGGETPGEARITASLSDCPAVSDTVTWRNFWGPPENIRVVVMDARSGEVIDGAVVFVEDQGPHFSQDGVVEFDGLSCPEGCTVHVFHEDYSSVSVFGLYVQDLLIPLSPVRDLSRAAGVVGVQDTSPIPDTLRENSEIQVGLSGFGIKGSLLDWSFDSLLEPRLIETVMIGTVLDEEWWIPSGAEAYLMEEPLKGEFQALGDSGDAILWGIGGFVDLSDLLELFVSHITDDEVDFPGVLAGVMPWVADFYHGVVSNISLSSVPLVADSEDLNGNGQTDDLVPDYAAFEDIGSSLRLTQAQTQEVDLSFGTLPDLGVEAADCVVAAALAETTRGGLIPLGVTVAPDQRNPDDTPDGVVGENNDGQAKLPFAPQHDGVVGGDYLVAGVAVSSERVSQLIFNSLESPVMPELSAVSVVLVRSANSPENVTMPAFLDAMTDAVWLEENNGYSFSASPIAGADFYRVALVLIDEDTQSEYMWHIYWPSQFGEACFALHGSATWTIEPQPIEHIEFQAVDLNAEVSYQSLFEFNNTNLNNINRYLEGWSTQPLATENR